jgi:hypothetical protein
MANEHEEWNSVRSYLIDRMTVAHIRVQTLEKKGGEPEELADARQKLAELNLKVSEHERKAP